MAPIINNTDDFLRSTLLKKHFTLSEAIEIMQILDTMPSGNISIQWINSRTGKPVSIGYTCGSDKEKKKSVKSSPVPKNYYEKYDKK